MLWIGMGLVCEAARVKESSRRRESRERWERVNLTPSYPCIASRMYTTQIREQERAYVTMRQTAFSNAVKKDMAFELPAS